MQGHLNIIYLRNTRNRGSGYAVCLGVPKSTPIPVLPVLGSPVPILKPTLDEGQTIKLDS